MQSIKSKLDDARTKAESARASIEDSNKWSAAKAVWAVRGEARDGVKRSVSSAATGNVAFVTGAACVEIYKVAKATKGEYDREEKEKKEKKERLVREGKARVDAGGKFAMVKSVESVSADGKGEVVVVEKEKVSVVAVGDGTTVANGQRHGKV